MVIPVQRAAAVSTTQQMLGQLLSLISVLSCSWMCGMTDWIVTGRIGQWMLLLSALALYKKTTRFWSLFEGEAAGVEPVTPVTPVMAEATLKNTCCQMRVLPASLKLL
jgi:hypothetical protein